MKLAHLEWERPWRFEDFVPLREQTEVETKYARQMFEGIALHPVGCGRKVLRTMEQWGMGLRGSLRHHRERTAPGCNTSEQVAARVALYGGLCWICRAAPGDCIDHVKPLSRGGSNWPANLRPACRSCNSKKRDKWPFVVEVK